MEIIDKQRSAETREAMAKAFNIGNRADPEDRGPE